MSCFSYSAALPKAVHVIFYYAYEANPAVLPGAIHVMLQLPCGRRLVLTTGSRSCHASATLRHYREPSNMIFISFHCSCYVHDHVNKL